MNADTLRQSYRANADELRRWLDLASRPTNPHRLSDFVTAAEKLGRVELLAAMLRELGDPDPDDEAEALAADFDALKWDLIS